MKIVRYILKYIMVFLFTAALLMGILVGVALIPQFSIKENVKKSAEFLCEGELFGTVIEDVGSSKIDRYADSILLAIAYQYDRKEPLQSVMWSSYYYMPYQNESENLLEAVTQGKPPNQQYLRYWHGSNAIVRSLLLVFDIQQIYIFNGILLVGLILWLMAILLREKAYLPAVGVAAGLILTSSWFVPLSLEYTWMYLVMLVMSILTVKMAFSGKDRVMGVCFLVCGMVANYLDFLTTETMTLLVPLLLVLWIGCGRGEKGISSMAKDAGEAALLWGFGYAGMWMAKWVMASIVLKENVMPYISGHIEERIGGNISVGWWEYLSGAILRNIGCLFPLEYGVLGLFVGIAGFIFIFYVGYVYQKKQICRERVLLYAAVGLVPYVRYLVLLNHSYLHYFFTYRAQMATVLAAVMILGEVTEWRWMVRENHGKRKS